MAFEKVFSSLGSLSYISHMHLAPVIYPENDPKIMAVIYFLQMPNLFKTLKYLPFDISLSILAFIMKRETTIKGNTEGIRDFEQNNKELYTLSFIYFAFVKNTKSNIKSKIINNFFLIFKSYYYPPQIINIPNRIYVDMRCLND
jgi:hypothetical protein